ncbi:CpaF family protein [Sagittula sp. SSi028]|uniref:CpaF family protein n=1 Tax=Sagittula sp. SSi028 TaxID=3400636 RepID=UPI003AF4301A
MTLHVAQPSLQAAVGDVLRVARRLDGSGLDIREQANTAISLWLDRMDTPWPMAFQRQVLSEVVTSLGQTNRPEEPKPVTVTPPAPQPVAAKPEPAPAPTVEAGADLMGLSRDIIASLSEDMDFAELAGMPRARQERAIRDVIHALSQQQKLHINGREVAALVDTVLADMMGLGPLEALLADDTVTDIMVNGANDVWIERGGKLCRAPARFRDNAHVLAVASRIVGAVGRRIDESQPLVDARLKDGSRVNVAVPPLAIDGPSITIRKFPAEPVKLDRLVEGQSMSAQMAALLGLAAYLRLNILISGGTGSGKTTLMNAMSQFIPEGERIVTIEDAAELRFQQGHVVRFETRPPNVEGTGEITMRTLVKNALRMRPDRIVIGEIRGDEVLDLLQAMNTGHDGSMSTLHANTPREALVRVESMAALAGFDPSTGIVRRQLAEAVHLVVQVQRMRDGKRRVTSISEIAGLQGDAVTLQELFRFRTDPDSPRTEVRGRFECTGYRPKFAQRAAEYGVSHDLDAILQG